MTLTLESACAPFVQPYGVRDARLMSRFVKIRRTDVSARSDRREIGGLLARVVGGSIDGCRRVWRARRGMELAPMV